MKKANLFLFCVIAFNSATCIAQSDVEFNRDSVIGWQYISNPVSPKTVYKPVKSLYANGAVYSVWHQQTTDKLISWIQQSYLPRGIVMRTIAKNDNRWDVDENGPLHSYGVDFLGFAARFANGKIDLRCCEQGQRLQAGFNDFPGVYVKGFNPGGLYFFAEQASFTSGDDDAQLSKEGIDKRIQSSVYAYRTYFDHYHDNGQQVFKLGVVVPKNGEWPFKPVLVKDAVAYIQQQMATYPGILQKFPFAADPIKKGLERLKPYYNEVVKLVATYNYTNAFNDGNGHYLLDPDAILNGKPLSKTFPEYNILVATTQQTIDQSKTDNPLWVYFNLTPSRISLEGNPSGFDTKFGTGIPHMVYSLLNNFNFDYVARWMAQPDIRNNLAYTPAKPPAKTAGNTFSAPTAVSATAASRNRDPYTILYEDFEGFQDGVLSAKKWHTAGNGFANSSLTAIAGQNGKWVTVPAKFTFYPDLDIPLTQNYTVNYDVYFAPGITNKRVQYYFRMDGYDPKDKFPQPMSIANAVDKGVDFSIAMSGETTTECKFRKGQYKEMFQDVRIDAIKEKDVAHVSVTVNGTMVSVSVNGKEVIRNDNARPAEQPFKRVGWYCNEPKMLLGNIYIRSNNPVQNNPVKEPSFVGVVKDKKTNTPDAATFETADYAFKPIQKIDKMPPVSYPAGFKSNAAIPAQAQGTNKAVTALPAFNAPARSAFLGTLPASVMTGSSYKNFIDDVKQIAASGLNTTDINKLDGYLLSKKITTSRQISNEAIGAWLQSKPTVALYLFCKALQADNNDMLAANNLASFLIAYGYAEKAIPLLQYMNTKLSGSTEILASLATAYYNLGDMNNAGLFADKCIAKDSLNANGNKVAAFVHLNKASQSNNKAEADKAIGCLKQALKSRFDQESSDLLNKIEGHHQIQNDFVNTNFKEFPMLRRLELPAMPEDLAQAKSFNELLKKEKSALSQTIDNINSAKRKLPETDMKQVVATISQNKSMAMMMIKAGNILHQSSMQYLKMKSDLEQLFTQSKNELTRTYNKKISAITQKYNALLNKLEGGEGRGDEEEEIERLKKARCEEYNKETAAYLSDIAKRTNEFAQRSELVSRTYYRDYANWMPVQLNDNSYRYFLDAQAKYILDMNKILSLYTIIEPCIYPTEPSKNDNKPAGPRQWENEYCANFKGSLGVGPGKINFTCNSISISGGEGVVGELGLTYNENGTFKEMTIGAGPGVEAHWGSQHIASIGAGVSAMSYITIGPGADGGVQVNDWGITAGASAGTNIGPVGAEVNIASATVSAAAGINSSGALPDALKILKK